jgi:hypothetical protein
MDWHHDTRNGNWTAQMTGSDVIVAIPWMIFAIALLVLFIRLLSARRGGPR